MGDFIANYWSEILLTLVSAGALGSCKYFWSKIKNYKKLLSEKEDEKVENLIEQKTQPIVEEIEELRDYIRKTENTE